MTKKLFFAAALAGMCLAMSQTARAATPLIRIMPVGDSITFGSGAPGGYRSHLYALLTNAGFNVDFVGIATGNQTNTLPEVHHEGHGGYRIDQIDALILSAFDQINDPDIILLLIGTNDYGQNNNTATATNRLEALIAKMATNRPYAKIIVSSLTVRGEPLNTAIQTNYNPFVPLIVERQAALGRQVYFTDLYNVVPLSDMPDNLHPNLNGYVKMATNWFTEITNLFTPVGSPDAPAILRVVPQPSLTNLLITFSKPVADDATNLVNFTLDGGVTVLNAELEPTAKRNVLLTTTPQTPRSNYTITVNNVHDLTAAQTPIVAGSTASFTAANLRGATNNVPDSTNFNYSLVYSLALPASANYVSTNVLYDVDQHTNVAGFNRVAYYLELQPSNGPLQFLWASMDTFSFDAGKIGIPTARSGATFQQFVNNLTVISSVPGIVAGTNLSGGYIEFWSNSYNSTNVAKIPGASDTLYDWGDQMTTANGYGSMQVHNASAGQVLFAFNHWGSGGATNDLGMGNNASAQPDWTSAANANNYIIKTLQVYVAYVPDTNSPTLLGASGQVGWTNVSVTFNEPIDDSATNLSAYAINGGLTVLSATLDTVTKTIVTLTTSPQAPNTTYTLTVNGITDRSTNYNQIAPNSTVTFKSVATRGAFTNVPEASDYTLVYSLNIPNAANYAAGITYDTDLRTYASNFTRVAYYLELQTNNGPLQYIWVSLDPLTNNVNAIGVPTLSSGALFQRPVSNMNVWSSETNILTGTSLTGGNVEFWPSNYTAANGVGVTNASGTVMDWGDTCTAGNYGCMQIHNHDASQVLFAFNRWGGGGGNADVGIGNRPGSTDVDWTFAQNATNYIVKTLQIYVLPTDNTTPPVLIGATPVVGLTGAVLTFSKPLDDDATNVAHYALSGGLTLLGVVLDPVTKARVTLTTSRQEPNTLYTATVNGVRDRVSTPNVIANNSTASFLAATRGAFDNVPGATNFTVVYSLNIPTAATYNTTNPIYSLDLHTTVSNFSRVAYYLELQSNNGPLQYIWTEFDPFTQNAGQIGVPSVIAGAPIFQQPITNMTVVSSAPGIITGTNLSTGNIEFWPWDYTLTNAASVANASNTNFDWGDMVRVGTGGFGSLQVHNYGASQTLLAFNDWGKGGTIDLGIGNQPTGSPDWTQIANAASYSIRMLQVLVLPANNTNSPALVSAVGQVGWTNIQVTFSKPLTDDATNIVNFGLSGGLSVLRADLDPLTKSLITITTTPQSANTSYTLTVNGLQDRTSNHLAIASGSTIPFVAAPLRGVTNNIPEATNYVLAYSLTIPNSANYSLSNVLYAVDNHYALGAFSRVAYYLELQGNGPLQYLWVDMDPFTQDAGKIGVPMAASGAFFQQSLSNLNVRSSVGGIVTGDNLSGGTLEFWPSSYSSTNAANVPGASGVTTDWGDQPTSGNYGSMQIHNSAAGQVLMAFNHWSAGGNVELGIGNNSGNTNADWTYVNNGPAYSVKTLQVYVIPATDTNPPTLSSATAALDLTHLLVTFSEPVADGAADLANYSLSGGLTILSAVFSNNLRSVILTTTPQSPGGSYALTVSGVRDRSPDAYFIAPGSTIAVSPPTLLAPIVANVPEAAGYQLAYFMNVPSAPNWNSNGVNYTIDNRKVASTFSRVAYYWELATNGGPTNWIYVSLDPFTNDVNKIGVPDRLSGGIFQKQLTNMNVYSSQAGIVTGTGIQTGNMEFWPNNYAGTASALVPTGGSAYDWNDTYTATSINGHGTMQLHNYGAGGTGQVLFACNNFNGTLSLGIGNQPSGSPDWTFSNNAASYVLKNLYVLVRPAPDTNGPVVVSAVALASNKVLVTFNEPLSDAAAVLTHFALDGGGSVTAATLRQSLREVYLTTTPMATGTSYNLTITGVADRSPNANLNLSGSTPITLPDVPLFGLAPEAADYELVYSLALAGTNANYSGGFVNYGLDRSGLITQPFNRVAYYLELATNVGGTTNWVYVSANAFTTNIKRVAVPSGTYAFQQSLTNLNIRCNVSGVVTGTGLGGNMEFWSSSFSATNTLNITNGSSLNYDWGDRNSASGSYGSMQIHNYAAGGTGQVLFAINHWAGTGANWDTEMGIGNNTGNTNADYTFMRNGLNYQVRNLYVLVLPTNVPTAVVPVAPMIVTHPASRTNATGSTATLAVNASGSVQLTYQWFFNGNLLTNQTKPWLNIPNVQLTNSGNYSVVITNSAGSVTSSVAALTVVFINQMPVANEDGGATTQGMPLTLTTTFLLQNDTDPDNDPLSVASVSSTSTNGGAVNLSGTNVTYTPLSSFTGVDSYHYLVSDGAGGTATGNVVVAVVTGELPPYRNLTLSPTGSIYEFRFLGVPGTGVLLKRSTNLVDWVSLTNAIVPIHGVLDLRDLNPPPDQGNYRITAP